MRGGAGDTSCTADGRREGLGHGGRAAREKGVGVSLVHGQSCPWIKRDSPLNKSAQKLQYKRVDKRRLWRAQFLSRWGRTRAWCASRVGEAGEQRPVKKASESQSYIVHHYLTECVDDVVLQKSTPAQIRQLFLYISNDKG